MLQMFDVMQLDIILQSNLVNSKYYRPEVLFQSIENLNYREVDIKICKAKNDYFQFFHIKHRFLDA